MVDRAQKQRMQILACVIAGALALYAWLGLSNPGRITVEQTLSVQSFSIEESPTGNPILQLRGSGFSEQTQVLISPDISNQHQILGTFRTWQSQFDVATNGKITIVADNKNDLQILDTTDPAHPNLLTTLALPGRATGVALQGHYAYVGCTRAGLAIVDLAIPSKPRLISTLNTPGIAGKLVYHQKRIYLVDGQNGVLVIDVSDPSQPLQVGHLPTKSITWDLTVQNDLLLVANGPDGLLIGRIQNDGGIRVVGQAPTLGRAFAVASDGDFAYTAGLRMPLQAWDIRNPGNPTLVQEVEVGARTHELALEGNRLLVALQSGVRTFHRSENNRLHMVGEIWTDTGIRQIAPLGNLAYAVGYGKLYTVDTSTPKLLPGNERIYLGSNPQLAGRDNLLYVTSDNHLLTVTHKPGEGFTTLASTEFPDRLSAIHFGHARLYTADIFNNVYVMDMDRPHAPMMAYRLPHLSKVVSLENNPSLLAVAEAKRISFYPQEGGRKISHLDLPKGQILDLAFHDDWLFVSCAKQGLLTVDLSTPEEPTVRAHKVASWPESQFSRYNRIRRQGDTLFASNHELGLVSLDIDRPLTPYEIDSLQLPGYTINLWVHNGQALTYHSAGTLCLIDMSSPSKMKWVGEIAGANRIQEVVQREGHALLTDNTSLRAIPIPRKLTPNYSVPGLLEIELPSDLPEGTLEVQINNYLQGKDEKRLVYLNL